MEVLKICRGILQALLLPALTASCSKVGFQISSGSPQQLEALCGAKDLPTDPGPKITAPPKDQFVHPNITVEGTCEGSNDVELSGGGIDGTIKTACVNNHFSQAITLKDGDGMKDFNARQTGINFQANRCVYVDTTPPRILITAPLNNNIPNNTVSVIGECETGLPVELTQGRAPALTVSCDAGKFSARFPTTAGDGPKTVVARQTDSAGNVGTDDQLFIIDTVAPVVRIATPLAGAIIKNSIPVTGTCETGLPVNLSGTAVTTPVSTACDNGQFSSNILVSNRDGVFYITAEQVDAAGNRGWDQRNVIRDTTPPAITIKTPAANTVAVNGVPLTGSCTDGLSVLINGAGSSAAQTVPCQAGSFNAVVTFSSGDGTKNIVASQTDSAGNVGSDNRNFIKDATAPLVKIAQPATGTITRSAIQIQGTCESGLPVNLSGAIANTTAPCSNGQFSAALILTLPDGNKTITATQTDAIGNVGSDSRTFVLDTTAPAIAITGPAVQTVAQTGLTLVGTCTNGLPIELSGGISSPLTGTCANGQFSIPIVFSGTDGTKSVAVAQTDNAGNRGSDSRDFVKDTTPPSITITQPAALTVAQTGLTISGTCSAGLTVEISGTGVSAASTTTCPNGQFSAPITFSNGDGTKNVIVSQADAAGNRGSDNRDFVRDATAPALQITGPAAGSSTRGALTLTGTCASGLPVVISGAITLNVTVNCTNGLFSGDIQLASPDGSKLVTASQTDAAGNTGSDSRSFTLKTSAPVITIASPAVGSVTKSGLTVTGTCTSGLSVVMGGAIASPVSVSCPSGTYSANVTLFSPDGSKTVTASQTDIVGNSGSASRDFILDATAPAIAIVSPAANTLAQSGVTLTGTCETALPVSLTGTGLSAASTTTCTNGQFSAAITFSSGDGTKNIIASQTDAAGNTGSDNRDFVKNNVGPAIKITAPAQGTLTRSSIDLSGTCTGTYPVLISGAIASSVSTSCTSGQFAATVTLVSPDGAKTLSASQTDSIGNTGSDSRSFTLKTSAPTITIASPAVGSVTKSGLTVTGTCTSGLAVVMGGAIASPVSVGCPSGSYSANITLASPDEAKTVTASQTDTVGNSGSASRDFILDTTAPAIAITDPAANTVAQTGVTLTGTCETGLPVSLTGAGLSAASTTLCANGQFSSAITFSNGDGSKNIIASQTDAAGNTSSDNRNFIKDTTPPTITIASPAALTQTRGDLTIGGTCTDGLTITLGGAISPSVAVCTAGLWTALVTLLPPDGTKSVTASQTDLAGNTGSASRDFTLKTTAPIIKIAAPAANTVTRSSLTLTGTCATGLTVNLGASASGTTSCAAGTFSVNVTFSAPDGVKTVSVSQTDAAGNVGTDSRDFVLDTTAPVVKFTSPNAGTITQANLTVTGTCETGLPVQLAGSGIGTAGPVSCTNGAFNATITLSNGDGTKNITASQTDAAGNTGSDNRNFVRDGSAPVIKIVTPAVNAFSRGQIKLTGTCENGLTLSISGDVAKKNQTTGCSDSKFDVDVDLSSPDGVKNVVVSQTDAAGNTGSDNRNFILDTAAPKVTITSPANGTQLAGAFTLTGACEAGLALNISGDIQTSSTTTCPSSGTYSVGLTVASGNGSKKVTAGQIDLAGNSGSATGNYVVTPKPTATESFLADQGEGKVDILFVDDNSASMDPEQAALGQKFPSFVQELQGLDWQAGITTTDCSTGKYGICGSLLNMTGTSSYILNPAVAGFDQVFNNTIQRPETVNCAARGDCPSGLEEPLRASIAALDKRATNNTGFFRDTAALAIVVITDEDEQSNGPNTATKPQAVIDKVTSIWGASKKFKSYAITVLSGDTACLKTQQDQQNGIGAYGTIPSALATATGGKAVSICAPDYSVTLQLIGQDLRKLTQAVKLSRTPVASSVQVTFTPAQNITWTVNGDTVLFNKPVSAGTKIDVTYEY